MNNYFHIDIYSHHFVLGRVSPSGRPVIESFAKQYIQFGWVRIGRQSVRAPIKTYATRIKEEGSEYRFHIHQYASFCQHLANREIHPQFYTVTQHDCQPGEQVQLELLPRWVLRDYQVPAVEYMLSDKPTKKKLLQLQTGMGKSLSACAAAAQLGRRFAIVVRPQFIEKWVDDVKKYMGIGQEEVAVVQGAASLMALIAQARSQGLKEKVIIFSNRTLQQWFKLHQQYGDAILDMGYDCLPGDLFPVLGVGLRLIDEVHLDFHLFFKIDLYTHVERSISLSATLISDEPFTSSMQELAYPIADRYQGQPYNRYVNAYSWLYEVENPKAIRTMAYGSINYSHHEVEASFMRNKKMLEDYLVMIHKSVQLFFFGLDYKPGDRCLVYVSGVEFATIVTDYLKSLFPKNDVRRYVEKDPYCNLMEPEIIVSSLLSAGTGHDVPQLTTVILTVAVKSSASNIQGFGRLRNITGRKLKFIYFACVNVPKHMQYHEKKKGLLSFMALHYENYQYPFRLGR